MKNKSFEVFLKDFNSQMCTTLVCRPDHQSNECLFINGNGAATGTMCDSGKLCNQGECKLDIRAPTVEDANCVFGDDLIINKQVIDEELPFDQIRCQEALSFLEEQGKSITAYCAQAKFRKTCCQTCKSSRFHCF
jgi:hypothetical protein